MVVDHAAEERAAAAQPKISQYFSKTAGRKRKSNPKPPGSAKSSRLGLERGEAETSQVVTATGGTVVVKTTTTTTKTYAVGQAAAPAPAPGTRAATPGWGEVVEQWTEKTGPVFDGLPAEGCLKMTGERSRRSGSLMAGLGA
jgi:hypothetical protein